MPRKPLETSPVLAAFLRDRRKDRRLSLRDVERRTGEDGRPIPFSTLSRIESGAIDPGVRRLRRGHGVGADLSDCHVG